MERVCGLIAKGVWPHIASQSQGVSYETHTRWMRELPEFKSAIEGASAIARAAAESWVIAHDPRYYLRYGPARHSRDAPGWGKPEGETPQVNIQTIDNSQTANIFNLENLTEDELIQLKALAQKLAPPPQLPPKPD